MTRTTAVEILAVPGIPLVRKDDDLVALIGEGVARGGIVPRGGDVFVLTQKIVSKAEGRMVDLATVEPSAEAIELAGKVHKDPRFVELILSESVRVVRSRPGVLIVEHRLGLVMANAGIDQSNVAAPDDPQRALLLPVDPDGSAAILKQSSFWIIAPFIGTTVRSTLWIGDREPVRRTIRRARSVTVTPLPLPMLIGPRTRGPNAALIRASTTVSIQTKSINWSPPKRVSGVPDWAARVNSGITRSRSRGP